jgi:tetratricopeptide (TPR) repeat protein
VLRYARFDQAPGTMRGLVETNGVERFDIIGQLLDDSLASTYGLYRQGLVEQLRPRESVVDLTALSAVTDAALRSYHIPPFAAVASRPWERLILGDYGLVAYDVGHIFERSKRYADAREWYTRALAIDPDLVEARSALQGLPP